MTVPTDPSFFLQDYIPLLSKCFQAEGSYLKEYLLTNSKAGTLSHLHAARIMQVMPASVDSVFPFHFRDLQWEV